MYPQTNGNQQHGRAQGGKQIDPLTAYMQCQYLAIEPPQHEGALPTTILCAERAIIMPGYHRACPRHIMHILRRSLNEYLQREAHTYDSSTTTEQLTLLLKQLEVLERVNNELPNGKKRTTKPAAKEQPTHVAE